LYLQQEVQAEALVRNVSAFARFLEAISFSHGSLLNLAEVARECQVGRKTVELKKSGSEVDFVVYGEDVFVAIEVKRSRNVHHTDLRALKAFKEDYPEAQVCLLYMGQEEIKMGEVLCLPCDAFLRRLHPSEPLL
jgi:predicted AAA+ superfamily ATPase